MQTLPSKPPAQQPQMDQTHRIHLVGDSHIGCIAAAFKKQVRHNPVVKFHITSHSLGGGAVAYNLMMRDMGGKKVLNPLLKAALTNAVANLSLVRKKLVEAHGTFALCTGGYLSSVYTWDTTAGLFDFMLSPALSNDLVAGLPVIPRQMIKESLDAHLEVLVEAVSAICKHASMPVAFILPPPPYGDNKAIIKLMARRKNVGPTEMPQPMHRAVRLKVWRLTCEVLMERFANLPLQVISPPADTMDSDGFLLPKFYGDGFHANEEYGALMAYHIAALCAPQDLSTGIE